MTTRIMGTGSCLPEKIVTNDNLAQIMDTSDEWIRTRTGIASRHIAVGETTTSMASEACKKAMEDADVKAEEVELVIAATISPDLCLPSTACEIQKNLELTNAVAFDVNASCSGFLFALNTAHAYIAMGMYKTALIVGVETLSKMMDWSDRSTCVLFGDGAGAAVLRADEAGLLSMVQGSDGARGDALKCRGRLNNNPYVRNDEKPDYVSMDGQEVYRFAVKQVPKCIGEALEKAGLEAKDIKYFILHQANCRIIESVAKRLKVPLDRFPMNLEKRGNMSAASVPVLLDEINRQGLIQRGDKILLSGFGAGLTWGASVLVW